MRSQLFDKLTKLSHKKLPRYVFTSVAVLSRYLIRGEFILLYFQILCREYRIVKKFGHGHAKSARDHHNGIKLDTFFLALIMPFIVPCCIPEFCSKRY